MKAKKWIINLLTVAVCFSLAAVEVSAYERVDTSRKASLELQYYDSERDLNISGLELRLYKVADMSSAVGFTVTDDFKAASVFQDEDFSLEELDTAAWAALSDTLTAYVTADRAQAEQTIVPAAAGTTGEDGKVSFTELEVGLYLLEGDKVTHGSYSYTPAHYLLTLPTLDSETDTWEYDAAIANKYTRRSKSSDGGTNNPEKETVSRNVMKVWEDHDNAADTRPASVTVQLLCDSQIYDTVTLNEENNWKHSWVGLDAEATWKLVEVDVPEDYTVLVEQTGNTFVVTNTCNDDDIPDDDVPTGGRDSGGGGSGDDEVLDEDIPLGGLLPQTGVLWWPVQALTAAGIALFALGWVDGRKKRSEDA